jgi:hypothetical protein
MNHASVFERALLEALDLGPSAPGDALVADALGRAAALPQRRPRFGWLDQRAWPLRGTAAAPGMRRAIRIAVVALAMALLAATAAAAGSGLIDRLLLLLRGPVPIVEELGFLVDGGQTSTVEAAALGDGRVLLVGGADTTNAWRNEIVGSAFLFDPASESLVRTGNMTVPRVDPLLIVLADGRVLVVGGWLDDRVTGEQPTLATAELYDPSAGLFRPTADLPAARHLCPCGALDRLPWSVPRATRLLDGRVFVSGGNVREPAQPAGGTSTADIFDPTTERWVSLDVGCDASRGTQTRLADGRVLLLCVTTDDLRARLFDPGTNTFAEAAAPPSMARDAVLMPDDRVLLTGFGAMVYDPATDSFARVERLDVIDSQTGVAVDGRVILLGYQLEPTEKMPTYVVDVRTLEASMVTVPGFGRHEAVAVLKDGRILTVTWQFEARLLDPQQLP